jgi:hypothetical protein
MRHGTDLSCCVLTALVAASVFSIAPPARAQNEPVANYELFLAGHRLVVSLDIQSFLTDEYFARIKDGVDLILDCRLELKTPRRIMGMRTVAEMNRTIQISYRSITEDFLLRLSSDLNTPRRFLNLSEIRSFLADSIRSPLADADSLNHDRPYTLALQVTAISMTDFGLDRRSLPQDSSGSALEYLFHQFLSITGYGRREFSFESRPFLLSQLPTEP